MKGDVSTRVAFPGELRLIPIEERFRMCPACGATCPQRWTGCRHCGTRLPPDVTRRIRWGVALPIPRKPASPSESLEMEVTEGTVLVAELCLGSHPYGALQRSLADLLTEMDSTAANLGGRPLNSADGLAFLFPSTDDAAVDAAARAALAMLSRWRVWMGGLKGWRPISAEFRVGLNLGLLYRNGDEDSGSLRGGCLRGAEALARIAQSGTVLVSESVFPRLVRSFDLVGVDPASPRDAEAPGLPYLLLGDKAASPQDTADLLRFPFVGRSEELSMLSRHLSEALRGGVKIVHLIGEPGAGKSRLMAEFLKRARLCGDLDGVEVVRTQGVPYGGGLLHSIRSMLAERLGSEGNASRLAEAIAPVNRMLGDSLSSSMLTPSQREMARTNSFSRGESGDADRMTLVNAALGIGETASRPQHLAGAVGRFLRGLAEDQGLLLVLDDLHWMDDLSLDVWRRALDEVRGRSLVILSYRPSFEAEVGTWGGERRTHLRLSPLSEEDLARLEATITPSTSGAGDHWEVVNRSRGNPLYLEHALGLISDRQQAGKAESSLPETLHGVILARLELLANTADALNRPSSLWAGETGWGRSEALAELEELEARMGRWLDRLESWTQEGRQEIARYLDLLERVDFSLTLAAMRLGVARARHRRLPHAIDRLLAGSSGERLAQLEEELATRGDGVNTAMRAERAANHLLALGRAMEAARFYALATRAAEATGDGVRWGARHLREKHGDALREAGDATGAACCFEAALEMGGCTSDEKPRLRTKAAAARREAGDSGLAWRHLEEAGDSAEARVERALLALAEGELERCGREAASALEGGKAAWRAHAVLARLRRLQGDQGGTIHHLRLMIEECLLLRTRHERQEALATLECAGLTAH